MTLNLYDILLEVVSGKGTRLNESINNSEIMDALTPHKDKRGRVFYYNAIISYDDELNNGNSSSLPHPKGNNKGMRKVQIYKLGKFKGRDAISVYQLPPTDKTVTRRAHQPAWKIMFLDRITYISILKLPTEKFYSPAPLYRQDGDKMLHDIVKQVNFSAKKSNVETDVDNAQQQTRGPIKQKRNVFKPAFGKYNPYYNQYQKIAREVDKGKKDDNFWNKYDDIYNQAERTIRGPIKTDNIKNQDSIYNNNKENDIEDWERDDWEMPEERY